ncbi:replication initiation factor domain-containing protein [Undibacterium oligocarboniphilum]|uniref:Replication initiation factor domain-containing protein n=1 Tax=Undibacterium oligocarboniphilum TaxID=666702 RepID=A0A850QJA2_9BURK|nr:replication initiation factor domain-containing protein [Undibacterium oligocarboniphilum]MBC3871221.1 replication initiation factor domain-containing protein [Undibacterium oligocarboniphilum]NVO79197.1 replication initiation factor domain-containing protein [Undibacterium oligocarboniphilum]
MSAKIHHQKYNDSAIDSSLVLQDEKRSIASRLVIRDKSSAIEPLPDKSATQPFASFDSEETKIRFYGENNSVLIQHPIPNDSTDQSVAHIDWLGFSLRVNYNDIRSWLFQQISAVFDLQITEIKKAGWNGFKHCALLDKYGFVAWGGNSQRGKAHIVINGTGCSRISNWAGIREWGEEHNANITRIDLAHDDLDGAICNPEQILEWYSLKGFNSGGRDAKIKVAGDWHNLTDGRTIYIGTRGNKMLRCYEKGKQLRDPESNWFRVELELRNKNRFLPWEMLVKPGQYLAGSYPCLAFLTTEQIKLKTLQKATTLTLASITANASRLSGKAINVLMAVHEENAGKVIEILRRSGVPKRLEPYTREVKNPRDTGESR